MDDDINLWSRDLPAEGPAVPAKKGRLGARAASLVALLVILAVGAGLRFWDLGLARHSYDDSYPAFDALRILDGHQLLLIGQPSSVFIDNPPLMSYLQAMPLLLRRSPWAVYLFVVALNTVAVWLVYRVAREMLGEAVGLMAALLFAANPWVVYFSRTTWVQALVPFFMALVAWGLWTGLAAERPSARRLAIAGLACVAMMQTYVQAWGVLAQVGPLAVAFRRRLPRRALYVTAIALLVSVAVYGLGLSKEWDANLADAVDFGSAASVHLTQEGLNHAVRLVTGLDFDNVHAGSADDGNRLLHTLSSGVHYLLALALLLGVARALAALRTRGTRRRVAAVLLLWFGVPILLMSVSAFPVHPHYLLLTCPAGHILAAWGAAPPSARAWPRYALAVVLAAVAGVWGLNLQRANALSAARPAGSSRFEEWTLAAGSQVGDVVRDLAGDRQPARVASGAHEAVLSSLSATLVSTLQGLDAPDYVVLPGQEPLLYVLVGKPRSLDILGPRQESFPERTLQFADGTQVWFLRVLPYDRDAALALPQAVVDRPSEAGLSLLGYTLEVHAQPGEAFHCTTYWRVDELLPGRAEWRVGAFIHLLDADGHMLANVGGDSQWGYRWQLGDVYVQRMAIPVPADAAGGEYRLEIGLFDPIQERPFQLISPDGWGPLVVPVMVGKAQS